jgi:hypothetical protein
MTAAGWAALAIAVFGAFSYGAGSILQAVGAQRSTGTVRTLGHPMYLIGTACDLLAWAGSMIALRELAVYFVQSVLAGSLAVTVVAARVFLKARLRGRDVAAVVVTIAALTVLAMSAGPQEQVTSSTGLRLGLCGAALATALIGWGAAKVGSPGVVAALAGLSLGGAALAGRALSLPAQPMEHLSAAALAILTEPLAGAVVVFAATGMLLYTNALQHGQVGPVTAVLWISEVVAPSAVALALLGDSVRPGWELRAAVAGLITVGAAVLLATASSAGSTAESSDTSAGEVRRTAIPVGGRLPLALPSRESQSGTILWCGSPTGPLPIWRPPKRTHTTAATQIAPAQIGAAQIGAAQIAPAQIAPAQIGAAQIAPAQIAPAQIAPAQIGAAQIEAGRIEAAPVGAGPYRAQPMWTDPRPSPAVPVLPPPALYEPEQPSSDPRAGTVIWSGPPAGAQPIWRPPPRTAVPPAPRAAVEPAPARPAAPPPEDPPRRARSAWADPPAAS